MNRAYSRKESRIPLTICIIVFLVTFFLNNDLEIGYIFNYAFVAAFIGLSLVFDRKLRFSKITLAYSFLTAIVVIFSFLPNSIMDPESNNHAISVVIFFLCCALSLPGAKELRRAERILIFSALIMSIYILLVKSFPNLYWNYIYPHLSSYTQNQALTLMRSYNYGVPIGGSANYADYILALGLFICLGKTFSGYTKEKDIKINIILSIAFIIGMVIQNRRSELISTVLTLIIMYSLSVNIRYIEYKRFRRIMGAIVVIIVGIVFMYSRGMLDRYISTIIGLSKNGGGIEEVGNGRIALWNDAFQKFKSSPLIGIGWNQFRANNDLPYMQGINVHNDYLQWLCETGIVGFVLISMPTFYLWIKTSKWCHWLFKNRVNHSNEAMSYALISFGIQTFFLIMHFMDPCFYKLIFWPMFSLSLIMYNRSIYIEKQSNCIQNV